MKRGFLLAIIPNLLFILEIFCAISAFLGGYGLMTTNGIGMPTNWLSKSPFSSYILPGLILFCIVGGTQFAAAVYQIRKHPSTPEAVFMAGFGLMIWIVIEQFMISQSSWLQLFYFALGALEIILISLTLRIKPDKRMV